MLFRPLKKQADYRAVIAGEQTEEWYMEKWGIPKFPPSEPFPFQGGAYMPKRWKPAYHAYVLAGNAMHDVVHPTEPRTFTYREVARIMGFPDNWDVTPYWENRNGCIVFGKGVVVESGQWIGEAAKAFVEGNALEDTGEEVGDREFLVQHTNINPALYKKTFRP